MVKKRQSTKDCPHKKKLWEYDLVGFNHRSTKKDRVLSLGLGRGGRGGEQPLCPKLKKGVSFEKILEEQRGVTSISPRLFLK